MTQSLRINEKEYLPSVELGKQFGYTSDYVSKLARDEKILGTQVGRQWFVEPESLRTYIQQLDVEKKMYKENLSRQRKLERQASSLPEKESLNDESIHQNNLLAAGQALAVVFCGLIVGGMSLTAYSNGLKVADLMQGANTSVERIVDRVALGISFVASVEVPQRPVVANSILGTQTESPVLLSGTGPQFEFGSYAVFPESLATSSLIESASNPNNYLTSENIALPFTE